ncbi:hypothetical protein ACFL35_09890 [Candidatus Riflebacteria bacterium]
MAYAKKIILFGLLIFFCHGCIPIDELNKKEDEEKEIVTKITDNPLLDNFLEKPAGIYGLITIPTAEKSNPRLNEEDQEQFSSHFIVFSEDKFVYREDTDGVGQYFFPGAKPGKVYHLTASTQGSYIVNAFVHLPEGKFQYQHNVNFASNLSFLILSEQFKENKRILSHLAMDEVGVFSDWLHGALEVTEVSINPGEYFTGGNLPKKGLELFNEVVNEKLTGLELLLQRINFYSHLKYWQDNNVSKPENIDKLASFLGKMGFEVEGEAPLNSAFAFLQRKTVEKLYFHLINKSFYQFQSLTDRMVQFGLLKIRNNAYGSDIGENLSVNDLKQNLAILPDLPSLISISQPGSINYLRLSLLICGIPQKHYLNNKIILDTHSLDPIETLVLCYFFLAEENLDASGSFLVAVPAQHDASGPLMLDKLMDFLFF